MPTPPNDGDDAFDLRTLVLLCVAGAVVYSAYRNPELGVALGIGTAALLALHTLVKRK